MEIATLFTSRNEIISLFDSFIYTYPKIDFDGKDLDTAFFNDLKTGKRKLYYRFLLNDVDYEFSYNYSEEEKDAIVNLLGNKKIYSFDLSVSSNEFLAMLLNDFIEFLNVHDKGKLGSEVVISHPFDGVFKLTN